MTRSIRLVVVALCVLLLAACTVSPTVAPPAQSAAPVVPTGVTITVSAAADLIPAFEELGRLFTAQTGIAVVFNFGSTGQLAQQIAQGAPVDVFAAANQAFIQELDAAGLVIPDTVALYAIGRVTLWTRADSPLIFTSIDDLRQPAIARIAIANPEHAPYGVAASEALKTAGLWDELQPKLILGENVAQTLQYAETGNVDVALVALSLSIASGKEGRWVLLPGDLHNPLAQALAVVAGSPHEAAARQFAQFVNSAPGREVMRRYGFILPGEEPIQ